MIYEVVCPDSWSVLGSFDEAHEAREAYEAMLSDGAFEELLLFQFQELRGADADVVVTRRDSTMPQTAPRSRTRG